jgi:2,4-dienoyl-CoA reductase-like NADH-dependent reductase (Old Yellow Enzyme family)
VSADPLSRLLGPASVAGMTLQSHIVMAPMSRYNCPDGAPHDGVVAYYTRRAAAGVGLILSEGTYIPHPSAASYEGVPWITDSSVESWAKVTASVQAAGGCMGLQLWHTGSFRVRGMASDPMVPGFGPSANTNAFTGHAEASHAMTIAEISAVVAAYARGARLAQQAGFDAVEIHAAHGYLIDEFLWPATNRRSDAYGGSLANRQRLAVEVISAIRAEVGSDFPVILRFSQWKQQDYTASLAQSPQELADLLGPLVDAGLSLLHPSTRRLAEPAFPEQGPRTLAGWTRELTGLPVIAVGSVGLDRPGLRAAGTGPLDDTLAVFERGECDLVAVGRALIADADWVARHRAGQGAALHAYDRAMLDRLE